MRTILLFWVILLLTSSGWPHGSIWLLLIVTCYSCRGYFYVHRASIVRIKVMFGARARSAKAGPSKLGFKPAPPGPLK